MDDMADGSRFGGPAQRLPEALEDPRRIALIVVDMQNDFVRVGAPLEVPAARGTIGIIAELITVARAAAVPVLYTKFVGGTERTLIWRFNPQIAAPTSFCVPGHQRTYGDADGSLEVTDVIDELAPERGDPIIVKYGYDAFHQTNLADTLRAHGRDTLVIVGTVTQVCVESTARGAFHHQIRPVVVRDAVSSTDDRLADASLRTIELSFGDVVDASVVVQAFGAPVAAAAR